MIKTVRQTRCVLFVLILVFVSFFTVPMLLAAQGYTHTVKKGDTLWDICEKYYGDSDLWPKLWQMNPFITNPHFLRPGDVITLLDKEDLEAVPSRQLEKATVVKEPPTEMNGIDVSSLTTLGAIGFLNRQEVTPWGNLFSSYSEKLMLGNGDKVVVRFEKDKDVKPGDKFTIYASSSMLSHPITGKDLGYVLIFHGNIVLKAHLKENFYDAEIVDAFKSINIGDLVIPHEPVSPCIQPVSAENELITNIVAIKDQRVVLGKHSVVYLDQGFNQGILRGNLLQVLRIKDMNQNKFLSETKAKYSQETALFELPIGTILIIESRPDTATAVVLSSKGEFENGAYVKTMSWDQQPEALSRSMPRCSVE